ncbi:MAG TPA: hypothetical protein VMB47_00185 [Candidatus Aquilonibacter sp.]|nr:hypothetical protein [Candidatus Aquilonibacter sp.]
MLFDNLWRAERRQAKRSVQLKKKFKPLIESAKRNKDAELAQELEEEWWTESKLNDDADDMRSRVLIKEARKLGIEVPTKPSFSALSDYDDEKWYLNDATGNCFLTDKAYADLFRHVRKEKSDLLDYRMRYVTRVVVPVTGLIGTIMGLISLIYAIEKAR